MTFIVCTIFFLSGTAALIFETLWFRQVGLALGNSVWGAAVVLGGFMSGLALGRLRGLIIGSFALSIFTQYWR